jgi:hypothetical protein
MVASIIRIQSPLCFLLNHVLICLKKSVDDIKTSRQQNGIQLVTWPFTFSMEKISSTLRPEVINLQRGKGLTETFDCVKRSEFVVIRGIDFWAVLPNKTISKTSERIHHLFASTHNCEQTPFLYENRQIRYKSADDC